MIKTGRGRFYRALNRLKRKVKAPYPISVRIVPPKEVKNLWGDCDFTGKKFIIRIAKESWHTMLFVLIHEYAHCISWTRCKGNHDDEFGKAYALVWQAYSKEI